MVNVLMVAEKPKMAKEITKILSNSCYTIKNQKRFCRDKSLNVFNYSGNFRGEPAKFYVTSTLGHITGIDFERSFRHFDDDDCSEALFGCQIERTIANPMHGLKPLLRSLASNCEYLVLWLDCDKEGENICFEVIDVVQEAMCQNNNNSESEQFMDRVFRARFSSVTKQAIEDAMANLGKPNVNESLSVDARQELDLRIGCAFTRFQTNHLRGQYCNFDTKWVSFGPCQSPTLAFCVLRHDEVTRFEPEPYWMLQAEVELLPGQFVTLEWCRTRQFNREIVQELLDKLTEKNCTEATVLEVSETMHCLRKPEALNTVQLLKTASSHFGISPNEAIQLVQQLYIAGFTSYPRTETSVYPDGFDFDFVLRELQNAPKFRAFVNHIQRNGILTHNNGTNKTDHPPITPLRVAEFIRHLFLHKLNPNQSTKNALALSEYIAHHFLATLMRPCTYYVKNIIFDIGGELFLFKSRKVKELGFTAVLKWLGIKQPEESAADEITPEDELKKFTISKLRLVERMTVAPEHLTEAELITLMEKYGIGTDGSIPGHINNICARNYVEVKTNRRQLVPTPLGVALVHAYQMIDPELVKPTMRKDMERKLQQIADGTANCETLKETMLESYKTKFRNFEEGIGIVGVQIRREMEMINTCSKCKRGILEEFY